MSNTSEHESYALIYESSTKSFVLECLENLYDFNISATPFEDNLAKLSEQYGTVERQHHGTPEPGTSGIAQDIPEEATGDDLFGEERKGEKHTDEDAGPAEDNPFDFRHYLNSLPPDVETSPNSLHQSPSNSRAATPLIAPSPIPGSSSTTFATSPNGFYPVKRQQESGVRKRPVADPLRRPNKAPCKNKKTSNDNDAGGFADPSPIASTPSVQIRRPSTQAQTGSARGPVQNDTSSGDEQVEEDDGELIIEMDPDEKPRRNDQETQLHGLGITTPGGGGPISLRAALSRSASPAVQPTPNRRRALSRSNLEFGQMSSSPEEAEDNEDVDELQLGSPAVGTMTGGRGEHVAHGQSEEDQYEEQDDEAEFERERSESADALAQAMQEALEQNDVYTGDEGEEQEGATAHASAQAFQQGADEEEESEEE